MPSLAISYKSIFRHTESYGVISLHELKGNEVSHVFELAWISVWRGAFRGFPNSRVGNQLMMMSIGIFL